MDVRDTLLLACGTASSREVLRSIFEETFNLLEADNSQQAMLLLKQNRSCIGALLLDITAREKLDRAVLSEMEPILSEDEIPVIILTEDESSERLVKAFSMGATDVIPVNYDLYALQHRVQNIVDLYRHKWHLEELVDEQSAILQHSNDVMVDALSSIIEYRSVESGQHILRIRRFTQILLEEIARNCPEYKLTDATIKIISSASALHDVGKISIPDAVLNKPGKLTPEEWAIMKGHSLTGCRILESLGDIGNQEYLRYAHNICHYHHERWDGSGYPEGISGDEIPICAQVVGLADAYDALTSKRVYKDAYPYGQAVNMILNGECGAFSPKLLECFKHVSGSFESLARAYADGLSPKNEDFNTTLPGPVREDGLDTLESVQLKYTALLHYVDATIVEADLNKELYHVHYNPNPALSPICSISSLPDMARVLIEQIVVPEDRQRMQRTLYEDIPNFLRDGLRSQQHRFHIQGAGYGDSEPYDVTILRLNPAVAEDSKLIIIWQKAEARTNILASLDSSDIVSEHTIYNLLAGFFRYRNDQWLTLESSDAELSNLLGYSVEELRVQFQHRFIELVIPEDRSMVRQTIAAQLAHGRDVELSCRLLHKDGHVIWVLNKSRLVIGDDGNEHLYGVLVDVTQTKKAQTNLQVALDQYQTIFSQDENILFNWDLVTDTLRVSQQWQTIFGYPALEKDVLSRISTASHFHPDDIQVLFQWIHTLQSTAGSHAAEMRIAKSDGRYLWCRFRGTPTHNEVGKLIKIVGIITNIDEEKRANQALQDRAERDALTKLLNKHAARRQAEEYLSSFSRGAHCALMIIDLDNFKQVNDQYGHMFGDAVLTQAAKEIKKLFRSQDVIARIGGDEFMVLMRGTADRKLVESRCSQLISIFRNVFRTQLYDCPLSCSIGVALAPDHGTTYVDLFQHADQALYQAKGNGKNSYVFYQGADSKFRSRRKIVTAVNEKIDSDQQPGLADNSLVRYAFQRLYESGDVETTVNDILELVGRQMNVSRVYVFENSSDNKHCSNTFEWCNTGIQPEIQNLQNISYETDIPNYDQNFDEHGIFYCPDVSTLPKQVYDIVAPQGIKSMLHCAIRDNGVFRGYVGFDECTTNRMWTKEQINVLTFFAEMLSVFLLKKRAQDETSRHADDLTSILDNQNAWIYVIDPDTCQLRFLNAKAKKLAPDVTVGMRCHKGLMGLDEPCPNCPAINICQTKSQEQLLFNIRFDLQVNAEATLIQWGGKEACLITCRELKEKQI